MRVAFGGYLVASNTFASQQIHLDQLQRATLTGDRLLRLGRGTGMLAGFMNQAKKLNWDLVPLQFVVVGVGGKLASDAHASAVAGFIDLLKKQPPVDGIFLHLHGTAVAEGCDDCEGELLRAIRELVGDNVTIVASLDGHSNTTPLMVEQADMLIGVKTNPHYDFDVVGRKSAQMISRIIAGDVSVTPAWAQPAMAPALQKLYIAPGWPMDALMRKARNLSRDERVLDISLLGGFFCSDIRETGLNVTVTTNNEPELAKELAEQIKQACWDRRQAFHTDMVGLEEGIREAMELEGLVILGDLADSGGAGTPGDGTAVLAELLRQNASNAVIGNIVDPGAVQLAIQAGVGKRVSMIVGAKVDDYHGDPIEISGRVRVIQDGVYSTATAFNAGRYRRGPTVVIDCEGIEVILTSSACHGFEVNHFRSLGIEPNERHIVAIKSELQHRAAFAGIASHFIDLDTPGLASQLHSRLPYKKIRRPVFPLDDI
ncbi:MAG: M81 family metallopeptidase [Pseudomonadales bacterium]|nr:M81 family metallopeptidase [Pseudomonadales bacterium]